MQDDLCEIRFDIPLTDHDGPRQFERGWRGLLAAQKLTALAVPPAEAVSARFCLCGPSPDTDSGTALARYLPTRLAALPGKPAVAVETSADTPNWHGVKIWVSYRSRDLTALLQKSKKSSPPRGRRS